MYNGIVTTLKILSVNQINRAKYLLFLMFVGMLFEMLGVGLIVPIVSAMTSQNILADNVYVGSIFSDLNQADIIVLFLLILLSVYLLKAFFLSYLLWVQKSYVSHIGVSVSQKLFDIYLSRPYSFHLKNNSAMLVRNITGDVGQHSKAVTLVLVMLVASLNLFGILLLLFIVEPVGMLIITMLISTLSMMYYVFFRNKLASLGELMRGYSGKRMQHIMQGLGGIKDVKVLGREGEFKERFRRYNQNYADVQLKQQFVTSLPGYWFEFIAVMGLVALVLGVLYQEKPIESLVPTLGLFAVAAFRMLPSFIRLLDSIQKLRVYMPSIQNLYHEFFSKEYFLSSNTNCELLAIDDINNSNWQLLKGVDIEYSYDGNDEIVLKEVNISVKRGQSIGVVGESGSGKSTLVDVLLGLLSPTSGRLELDGVDLKNNIRGWQNIIGYVPQNIYLTDDTLRRNVAFGVPEKDICDEDIDRAIELAKLTETVGTLAEGLNTFVGENGVRLSGGQRQRIGIARALYHDPSVLVLDEATSALDIQTEKEVMKAINALHGEKTIIIIAHRLSTIADCDYLYKMENGKIVSEGGLADVVEQN